MRAVNPGRSDNMSNGTSVGSGSTTEGKVGTPIVITAAIAALVGGAIGGYVGAYLRWRNYDDVT